jgi:hypothetical protein
VRSVRRVFDSGFEDNNIHSPTIQWFPRHHPTADHLVCGHFGLSRSHIPRQCRHFKTTPRVSNRWRSSLPRRVWQLPLSRSLCCRASIAAMRRAGSSRWSGTARLTTGRAVPSPAMVPEPLRRGGALPHLAAIGSDGLVIGLPRVCGAQGGGPALVPDFDGADACGTGLPNVRATSRAAVMITAYVLCLFRTCV